MGFHFLNENVFFFFSRGYFNNSKFRRPCDSLVQNKESQVEQMATIELDFFYFFLIYIYYVKTFIPSVNVKMYKEMSPVRIVEKVRSKQWRLRALL